MDQAQNFYKKVCIDPYVASVDSRILIYRFQEQGKLIENYHDDGEHGAGRRLLKYMQENQVMNVGGAHWAPTLYHHGGSCERGRQPDS